MAGKGRVVQNSWAYLHLSDSLDSSPSDSIMARETGRTIEPQADGWSFAVVDRLPLRWRQY
jgi:hypothetical protein